MANRFRSFATFTLLVVAAVLTLLVASQTTRWLDGRFPGFFVDPAGEVSLLALPGWPGTGQQWPTAITSIDGVAVRGPDHLYQLVRTKPEDAVIAYGTSRMGVAGAGFTATARTLNRSEFAVLFLGLLLNGFLFLCIAISTWRKSPTSQASIAFLVTGVTVGMLAITSVAVVADGSLARLNILAQSFAAAGILHLALTFPTNLLSAAPSAALFAIYTPFAALALVYQLTWPDTYGTNLLHGTAAVAIAAASLAFVAGLLFRLLPRNPIVVRRRAAIGLTGVAGVAAATAFWIFAKGADWRALTAALCCCGALVPLAVAGAIGARDFFRLDERLRRIITYAVAIPTLALLYFGAVHLLSPRIAEGGIPFGATIPFAILNLVLVLTIAPVLHVVRGWVDRYFSPESYSIERSLTHLNRGLSSARTTQTLVANTIEILRRTLEPKRATVFLRGRGAGFSLFAYDDPEQRKITVPGDLAEQLESGEDAVRYQWDDGSHHAVPRLLDRLGADLLAPIYRGGSCVGVIALSSKESGHPYGARDIAFIRTAANQIALALPNAAAQDKLEVLHKNLDELSESLRVQTSRTETLKAMNQELGDALNKLRDTHQQLHENQQAVMRAERLAALSRLSTGLTQEIIGPLGAVLNSLRGIAKIGREHAEAARPPEKQREAIDTMLAHAESGAGWLERAIAYLRSFQALGRGGGKSESFAVRDAFSDVTQLLRLRLRETGCQVEFSEQPDALELYGSRQRFVLVLVDLVTAAIDAYERGNVPGGRIGVEAELTSQGVCVRVVDWAGGIPSAAIPQLFDQIGSEDVIGNRRGLWIAKNLVEEGFGGTLEASTNDEMTSFIVVLPSLFGQRGPLAPPPSRRAANG
jgi:GAF domain-containing protein